MINEEVTYHNLMFETKESFYNQSTNVRKFHEYNGKGSACLGVLSDNSLLWLPHPYTDLVVG